MDRLINADALYMNLVKMKDFGELTAKKAIRAVENAPTIDAEPVIRCKDCKYFIDCHRIVDGVDTEYACKLKRELNGTAYRVLEDDYCSRAERKDND